MDFFSSDAMEILRNTAVLETLIDVLICVVPIWVAVMIGLIIGWSWRPRWTGLLFLGFRSKFRFFWTAVPPGLGARRLWFAFTAVSAFSVLRRLWSSFSEKCKGDEVVLVEESSSTEVSSQEEEDCTSSPRCDSLGELNDIVTEKDLEYLFQIMDGNDGNAAWQNLMERSTPNMTYQAWRFEPAVGPTQYRSKTVFEDATPDLVRDFFWDDEFRPKWDPMLVYCKTLEECPQSGAMIVHWIKKFPFFCSDREYIIGRRIWEAGKSYYCVSKAVQYPALPRHDKPRRVELYYSSWCIRPVESRKGDGQFSACEVTLIHYEDMGIPKDVANVGVRHGMWGAVKKLQSGVRAYQNARRSGSPLSRSALMAQINVKVSALSETDTVETSSEDNQALDTSMREHGFDWRWVVVGGAVAVVGLHMGILGKTILFGAAARRLKKK